MTIEKLNKAIITEIDKLRNHKSKFEEGQWLAYTKVYEAITRDDLSYLNRSV